MPPKIKILINHINVIDDLESMPLNLYKGFNPITKVSPHGYTWSLPPIPTLTFLQSPLNPKHIPKSKQEGFTIKAINTNRQDSPQPFIFAQQFCLFYIYISDLGNSSSGIFRCSHQDSCNHYNLQSQRHWFRRQSRQVALGFLSKGKNLKAKGSGSSSLWLLGQRLWREDDYNNQKLLGFFELIIQCGDDNTVKTQSNNFFL